MRSRFVLAVALGLALVVPARALGAAPVSTTLQDTAVSDNLSPDQSPCQVLTLSSVPCWPARWGPRAVAARRNHGGRGSRFQRDLMDAR
jgi:hypothetical protein